MTISSRRHLQRQARLSVLVHEAGDATALAARTGTPRSHISAMQAGTRGVGDALAAKFERIMGKPAGWMDAGELVEPEEPRYSKRAHDIAGMFDAIEDTALKRLIYAKLAVYLQMAKAGQPLPEAEARLPNPASPPKPSGSPLVQRPIRKPLPGR